MALAIANIHLLDLKQKAESGFSLCGDGFPDVLHPSVFLTTILICLGIDGWL